MTVVLNSKPQASCACGATWVQEGSWQRSIRPPGRPKLVPVEASLEAAPMERELVVIPDPGSLLPRSARRATPEPLPDAAEQAIAT